MNYVQKILYVLNLPLQQKIKDGKTKGWQFKASRKVVCGLEVALIVPLGLSIIEADKCLPALIATCGKHIELEGYKGTVVVRVFEKPMPTMIPFKAKMLEGLKPSEILIGYDALGNRITFNWELPHGIIAGETGMGKTDLIRLFTFCLLRDPDEIDIRIIDLKSLSFLPFKGINNVTIGTGLTDAYKMLSQAANEVMRRNKWIEGIGSREAIVNLQKIVVIIDEAADLSPNIYKDKDMKKFASEMERFISTISRMGREVKVHLLYCTQYPTTQVLSSQIKINCGMRVCFYVPTQKNSEVVLEKEGAEDLNAIPGRAIFKKNLYTTLQVPYVGGDKKWSELLTELRTVVIHDGNSKRADKERNYTDGSYESTDSHNATTSETVQQRISLETGKRTAAGVGERQTGGMGMAQTRKTMALNSKRIIDAEWVSDEL